MLYIYIYMMSSLHVCTCYIESSDISVGKTEELETNGELKNFRTSPHIIITEFLI